MLQRQNINDQINSRFKPATDLKIGTIVLIPNFNTQKRISKKLQPLRKGPYHPYYPKEYALRELTQLYSFTGLKVIQNNTHTEQKTNVHDDVHHKQNQKQITKTPDPKISQRERKNRKLI